LEDQVGMWLICHQLVQLGCPAEARAEAGGRVVHGLLSTPGSRFVLYSNEALEISTTTNRDEASRIIANEWTALGRDPWLNEIGHLEMAS
jgi:hypothetical protein